MLCIMGALFFFFYSKRKFKSVFLCLFITCHSYVIFCSVVPFSFALSRLLTFSFLFGITKLERWVYFLLFFPFILLSLDD